MNSLRSALTAVLAGPTLPQRQAKADTEFRPCTSDILTIVLVQNTGLVSGRSRPTSPEFLDDLRE